MMANIAWPEGLVPTDASWQFKPNVLSSSSRFTNKTKNVLLQGSRWECSYRFDNVDMYDWLKIETLLADIIDGTATVSVPVYGKSFQNWVQLDGRVFGAGQIGTSINSNNWPVDTKVLSKGQLVGIGGELKTVTSDVISNSVGEAVIPFKPELRDSPVNESLITYAPAMVTMEIVPNSETSSSSVAGALNTGNFVSVSLSLREAVN